MTQLDVIKQRREYIQSIILDAKPNSQTTLVYHYEEEEECERMGLL